MYYFRSQMHQTLQVKVTVMDCESCIAVAGYDGAVPATLALALSSCAAGNFALAAADAGMARMMTFLAASAAWGAPPETTLRAASTPRTGATTLSTAGAS